VSTENDETRFMEPLRVSALPERYEMLGELGRGGMGIVYKVRDRETGEVLAIKILKPEIVGIRKSSSASRTNSCSRTRSHTATSRASTNSTAPATQSMSRWSTSKARACARSWSAKASSTRPAASSWPADRGRYRRSA